MSTKNPFGSGVELITSNEERKKTNEKRAENRRHTEKILNNFQRLIDNQGMNEEYNNFRNVREEISNNSMSFLKDEIDALKGRVAKMEYDIRRLKTVKSGKNKNKPKTQKLK